MDAPTYAQVYEFENLLLAHKKSMRSKRSRPDVAAFEFDCEWHLLRLRASLFSRISLRGGEEPA